MNFHGESVKAKKILILFADTGGGHRSAAEAIRDALCTKISDQLNVKIVDFYTEYSPFPFSKLGLLYAHVTDPPWLWALIWKLTNNRVSMTALIELFSVIGIRVFGHIIADVSPDLIVSVHPVASPYAAKALRKKKLKIPLVTVVTDLVSVHRLWCYADVTMCIVPTNAAQEVVLKYDMPADKLRVVSLPVSLKYLNDRNGQADEKQKWRAKLGLSPAQTTVLLVGGGEGMGPLYEIARAIARARLPLQLVVIAGRNKKLYQRLGARQWEIPVSIQSFVWNMPEWMRASDVVITKAGPGTISEALACGLPILLSGFLPGQEEGNVHFVVEEGIGVLRQEPGEITQTLRDWLVPGNDALARMAARAGQLARPRAALTIAEILNDILTEPTVRI